MIEGAEYVTLAEFEAQTGVRPALVYDWIRSGRVRPVKVKGRVYAPFDELAQAELATREVGRPRTDS